MNKFIKLTNNFEKFKGNPIYINVDHIVAVYDDMDANGMTRTIVFGSVNGIMWDVEEPVSKIIKMIEEVK